MAPGTTTFITTEFLCGRFREDAGVRLMWGAGKGCWCVSWPGETCQDYAPATVAIPINWMFRCLRGHADVNAALREPLETLREIHEAFGRRSRLERLKPLRSLKAAPQKRQAVTGLA